MKTTFRWYGTDNDTVSLKNIAQIPGMEGIVWALHDMAAGEVWPEERIAAVKAEVEAYGMNIDVVESVNVHEDIKLGRPSRDQYIENYKQTLQHLGKYGVKVVCYNFMPVFDWLRTDLFHETGTAPPRCFTITARLPILTRANWSNASPQALRVSLCPVGNRSVWRISMPRLKLMRA